MDESIRLLSIAAPTDERSARRLERHLASLPLTDLRALIVETANALDPFGPLGTLSRAVGAELVARAVPDP